VALLAGSGAAFQDAGPQAGALAVTAVRHWSLGETTRVVVEVSGQFQYRYDRLSNPDRVYFDVAGAKPALSKERIYTISVDDEFLKQIRVSEALPGTTRVVLDLKIPVDFSASQLANPDRLVIELRRQGQFASSGQAPVTQPVKPQQPAAPPAEVRTPVPAKKSQSGSNSLVRALGLKLERVVLDPGHGGYDVGTTGPTGLFEKDLVLDIARRLGAIIEERLGAEVIYTRTDDTFVPLEARTALANEKKADLFLSIHANAGVSSVDGTETYYLNFTTSRAAMDVAARENASSERNIHELQNLIEKIALRDKIDESQEFAARVQEALCKGLGGANPQARDRGVKKAPFVVLIGAGMPSVLTEIAFLSNPREEKSLRLSEYRQKVAEALFAGVSQYAASLSRFQVVERKAP
jgi:N-acetylmuramoyl-L-alanine amidase